MTTDQTINAVRVAWSHLMSLWNEQQYPAPYGDSRELNDHIDELLTEMNRDWGRSQEDQ